MTDDATPDKYGAVKRQGEHTVGDTVRFRGDTERVYRLEAIHIQQNNHVEATLRFGNRRGVSRCPLAILERVVGKG